MYEIVIERSAQKELGKIPPPYFNRIIKAINNLSSNPRPEGYKKLTGRPGFRIRIGDYRVIYEIENEALKIFVVKVGNRKDIYK